MTLKGKVPLPVWRTALRSDKPKKIAITKPAPQMAFNGTVPRPNWRPVPETKKLAEVSKPASPKPIYAPIMAIKGKIITPSWRPKVKTAKRDVPVLLPQAVQQSAPVMAIKGKVVLPNWRPDDGRLVTAYLPPVPANPRLALATVTKPTWRPG